MSELVKKLQEEGRFVDAYIVAKNALSKDIGNAELFQHFIDLALEIAMYDIIFDERKQYVSDANSALSLFAENVDMSEAALAMIKQAKARVTETFLAVCQAEEVYFAQKAESVREKNSELLNQLVDIYNRIKSAKDQSQFEKILSEVSQVEAQLAKEVFSANQQTSYEMLSKSFSQAISEKMEELNRNELLDYNKRAVSCFNDVLQAFKRDSGKYKNESNLKALMTSKFFVFDSSKLFNETLVFYNHVYSVVFQDVNDTLKFKLTEWALRTDKIQK